MVDGRLWPSAALWWTLPNAVVVQRYTRYWRLPNLQVCPPSSNLILSVVWKHDVIRETGST